MRYALLFVVAVAWALWTGVTAAVFRFGLYFFHHLPADAVGPAVDAMFNGLKLYQIALAAVALAASGLALTTWPSRWTLGLVAAFLFAGITSVIFGLVLLPQMEILRHEGMVHSDDFARLHGQSMVTLLVQLLILLAGGASLLGAIARRPKPAPARVTAEAVPV